MSLTATVATAITVAENVDKSLGLISKFLDKFKSHPDVAGQKLAQALEEVAKTYQVVDNAFSTYLSIGIDEGALEKSSKPLLAIEGGALSTDVERGRGHCTSIKQIHDNYLNRWFASVFQSAQAEYDQIQSVFQNLADGDEDLFDHFVAVVKELQGEATAVLDLVVAGKKEEARQRILGSRPALGPLRQHDRRNRGRPVLPVMARSSMGRRSTLGRMPAACDCRSFAPASRSKMPMLRISMVGFATNA